MRIVFAGLICLSLTCAAGAETITLAEQGTVIPYGETVNYTFTPTGDYRSARLVISVRIDSPACAGSTYVMGLRINGEGVNGSLSRTATRLLNKPLTARTAGGLELPWVSGTRWRVCYAPDFEILGTEKAGSSRILDHSAYRSVIDITDMVKRDTENTLTIEHFGERMNLRHYFKNNPTLDLVLDELAVELSDEPSSVAAFQPAESFSADRLMIQPPATCDVMKQVTLNRDGGMTVTLPGMRAQVVSRFSWQGGGFNVLGADPGAKQQEDWRVEVHGNGAQRTVIGAAPEYRVERNITFAGDHVEVSDTLTNTTDADIGLAFGNELRVADEDIAEIYLGGNPDPAVTRVARMENSTAFVQGRKSGCGLLARDDVYRIQGLIYYTEGGSGIRSDNFCLGAGDSYTVRWSLYPVLRPDYFDFINLCRRDLDVNFTVPGGFDFSLASVPGRDDGQLRAYIKERDLRFISSGVWTDPGGDVPCYHGAHMLKATQLQAKLREACAKLHDVAPAVKSLIYIHCFINTDPEGPKLFPDSRVITRAGTQYENPGYTRRIGIPFLYYYPAVGNSYLEAMKRVVDMCLDDDKIGADGIYWDELSYSATPYHYGEPWDGYSGDIDPKTMKVARCLVQCGPLTDNRALLKGGVKEGEMVAVSGVTLLREGMQVRKFTP